MKASTVLITISALAAAIAGAVLLRRHFHEKQQAEAHFMQVDAAHPAAAPVAQIAAAAKKANPITVAHGAAIAHLTAQKPTHPAKLVHQAHTLGWDTHAAV
jgi:hypothetical protein